MQKHELSSKRLLASVGTTLVDPMRRLDHFGLLTLPASAFFTTSLAIPHRIPYDLSGWINARETEQVTTNDTPCINPSPKSNDSKETS
jgi:hypothetical protein